ncbi:hypothetical protein HID58_020610 [Brassica napus]|uniref:BnaA06g00570D protein n=3 Tax=Brassica TaxID=3705 RepID=A0A078GFG3_BRANA|nr:proline-rich receptor-like protein kinase PERK2 [Brassica napus]CAG7867784.1 unnamed protein product [Brassica rapa]KAH0920592.1 hypothetical protein HID58_020610 [Brassica napus]CAF2080847.1 unnamed protein product [Brassica napus]CDY24059.1 BnaA06g00570D [Brassica napus]VDC64718.1 unnamed protein product [Brassica rapa]
MCFLNPLHILIFALSFTIHCFLLVKSQEPPLFTKSSLPPPPPPSPPLDNVTDSPAPSSVSEVIAPLSSPPRRRRPKSEPFPPPPEPRRVGGSPEKNKRGGLNKGETVGLVFVGLIAMLQVLVVVFMVLKRRQLLRQKETQ